MLRAAAPQSSEQNPQPQQDDDPMMKMLSQLMGGMQSTEGDAGRLPPGLAAMLGDGGANQGQGAAQAHSRQPKASNAVKNDALWKVVHALIAFALAVYVTVTTLNRSGLSALETARAEGIIAASPAVNVFWAFATVEMVLQSTRYFLEMGQTKTPAGGMVGTLATILPPPWKGYLLLALRYRGIWSTIVDDGCVIIFVVGIMSWFHGAVD